MANKKISQLTPKGSALAGTDLLEVSVFNGVTYDTKSLTGANVVSGLQPTLVSGTSIKTINSTSLLGSGDIAITVPSGIFGISNASGVYTYYATFTLAMAAAVSGQTIEMFADVTETGAVTVTLKNGVNINGNGHTYTHTNSTASLNTFLVADSVVTNVTMLNLNVTKSNSTGSCIKLGTNGSGLLMFTGTKLINSSTGACISSGSNCDYEIVDVFAKSNSSNAIQINGFAAKLRNAYAYSESSNAIIVAGGGAQISGCTGISNSGIGLNVGAGTVTNCTGISSGGIGIYNTGGRIDNCQGYSSASYGIHAVYSNIYFCFGYSAANIGIFMDNDPTNAYNCFGYSSVNYGIASSSTYAGAQKNLYNCTALSDASIAMLLTAGLNNNAISCTVISKWNNAAGHGIRVTGANNQIIQCAIEVTNASANAINATSALTAKYANNSFKGPTTAVNANITQGVTNIHDLQGNITT